MKTRVIKSAIFVLCALLVCATAYGRDWNDRKHNSVIYRVDLGGSEPSAATLASSFVVQGDLIMDTSNGDLYIVNEPTGPVYTKISAAGLMTITNITTGAGFTIGGTLTLGGGATLDNSTATQLLITETNIVFDSVTSVVITNGAFIANGTALLQSTLGVVGIMTTTADVNNDATGGATGDPDFDVDGYAKFNGTVEFDGAIDADSTFTLAGLATLASNLVVDGTHSHFTNSVTIGGAIQANSTLAVVDEATFTGAIIANSTLFVTNGVTVGGAALLNSTVGVVDVLTTTADVNNDATGGSTGDPDFDVDGYAKFNGTSEFDGDIDADGALTLDGLATLASNLIVNGTSSHFTNSVVIGGTLTQNDTLTMAANKEIVIDGKWAAVGSQATTGLMVDYGTCTNGQALVSFNGTFGSAPSVVLSWTNDVSLYSASTNASISALDVSTTDFVPKTVVDGADMTGMRWIAVGARP